MKKVLFAACVAVMMLCIPKGRAEAKTVTYNGKKHEKLLSTVAAYPTLHYKTEAKVEANKGIKGLSTKAECIVDTKNGLVKVKVRMDGMVKGKAEYIYDLNHDRLHLLSSTLGNLSAKKVKEGLMEEGIVKGVTTEELVKLMLKQRNIGLDLKGKLKKGEEHYGLRVKVGTGEKKSKVSVSYHIKKKKKGYLPIKVIAKSTSEGEGFKRTTKSLLIFLGFHKKRINLPK